MGAPVRLKSLLENSILLKVVEALGLQSRPAAPATDERDAPGFGKHASDEPYRHAGLGGKPAPHRGNLGLGHGEKKFVILPAVEGQLHGVQPDGPAIMDKGSGQGQGFLENFGARAQDFRAQELTGTNFCDACLTGKYPFAV